QHPVLAAARRARRAHGTPPHRADDGEAGRDGILGGLAATAPVRLGPPHRDDGAMTGAVLLIGVGVMLVLAGLVMLVAMLLGVQVGSRQVSRTRTRARYEFRPIHAVAVVAGLGALLLTRWVAIGLGVTAAILLVPPLLARADAERRIARLEA